MTLHSNVRMISFAQSMRELWCGWDRANYAGIVHNNARRECRRAFVDQKIFNATRDFMKTPRIVHSHLGDGICGSFCWSSWELSLNKAYSAKTNIAYRDFLEFCATIYHETRHCEQFYRIAQGLIGGVLDFPDTSGQQIMSKLSSHDLGSVQQRKQMWETVSTGQKPQVTARQVAEWLNIPLHAASHAGNNALNRFTAFDTSGCPDWFKRNSIKLEVEEWMRECYKATLSGVGHFAQGDNSPWGFYANQPTERDAHGIEDGVVECIEQAIGVDGDGAGNLSRTDPVFDHL